jgi:hypothetical protein
MAKEGGIVQIKWETIIMTIGLVVVMVGGFWTLAYIPIDNNQKRMQQEIADLRDSIARHYSSDDSKYLTQKEHNEFKYNVLANDNRNLDDVKEIKKHVEVLRTEAITRSDAQQLLNTTRLEFKAEIGRIDSLLVDNMKRKEFEAWKSERDKTITIIQDRQNRFAEALDSMYSKIMLQAPSYQQR